jgi:DNA-binding transcriptional regulator YiaG
MKITTLQNKLKKINSQLELGKWLIYLIKMTKEEFKQLRQGMNMSQQTLATTLGMSPTNGGRTIRYIESGQRNITFRNSRDIKRLYEGFKLSKDNGYY